MVDGGHEFGPWSDWELSLDGVVEERERWCKRCPDHVEYQFRRRRD